MRLLIRLLLLPELPLPSIECEPRQGLSVLHLITDGEAAEPGIKYAIRMARTPLAQLQIGKGAPQLIQLDNNLRWPYRPKLIESLLDLIGNAP